MQNKEVTLRIAKEVFDSHGVELNEQCMKTLELVFNMGYYSGLVMNSEKKEDILQPLKNLFDTII